MTIKKNTMLAPPEISYGGNSSIKIDLFDIKDKDKLKHYIFLDHNLSDRDEYLINTIIDMEIKTKSKNNLKRMLCFGNDLLIRGKATSRVSTRPCVFIVSGDVKQSHCFLGHDEKVDDKILLRVPLDKIEFVVGIDYGYKNLLKYVIKETKEKKNNGKKK